MSERISRVAEELRTVRENRDPVSQASREVLPYTRRVLDALGALRAVVTDQITPHGISVTSGIEPGEWVATAGVNSLREGQQVRIMDEPQEG